MASMCLIGHKCIYGLKTVVCNVYERCRCECKVERVERREFNIYMCVKREERRGRKTRRSKTEKVKKREVQVLAKCASLYCRYPYSVFHLLLQYSML